jgi:hypothetical protein
MTEEKKNDLMVLQMRKVLDPKRFYKGSDLHGSLPKYFQVCKCKYLKYQNVVTLFMANLLIMAAGAMPWRPYVNLLCRRG